MLDAENVTVMDAVHPLVRAQERNEAVTQQIDAIRNTLQESVTQQIDAIRNTLQESLQGYIGEQATQETQSRVRTSLVEQLNRMRQNYRMPVSIGDTIAINVVTNTPTVTPMASPMEERIRELEERLAKLTAEKAVPKLAVDPTEGMNDRDITV